MYRYFFHISYCGANYRGWQRQSNSLSIQEVIEQTLENYLKYKAPCLGCGRTDAGVHAAQYFFHIDTHQIMPDRAQFVLNKALPHDISVIDIIEMDGAQHAQFSVKERTYDYFIHTRKDSFLATLSAYYPINLPDMAKMKDAAQLLSSYNDFKAFCKSPDRHNNTLCTIKAAQIFQSNQGEMIRFRFTADKYLKGMVRILVYKLLEIGQGKLSMNDFEYYLKNKITPPYNKMAYPQGLYLSKVTYPFLDIMPKQGPGYMFYPFDPGYWTEI